MTLALALAAAPPAAAGVVLRATVSPATVSSPAVLDYALQMINDGDDVQRLAVSLIPPSYTGESASVRALGEPVAEGPATLGGFVHVAGVLPECSIAGAGGHGYGIDGTSVDVALPPHSASALRAAYEAPLPFWPDLDLRMRFVARAQLTTGRRGTLPRDRKVLTPQPAITGPVAVHLTFRTTPATGRTSPAGAPPLALGKRVAVRGRANPAIPGQRVELRYARIGGATRVLERGRAGTARVGSDGTFRASWTPRRPGDYELWAAYTSQAPGLLSDDTCPRMLRVRR